MVTGTAVDSDGRRMRSSRLAWAGVLLAAAVGGSCLLIRATSLRGLPDIGEPFDVAQYATVTIPEDENAYTFFRRATDRFVGHESDITGSVGQYSEWSQIPPGMLRSSSEPRVARPLVRGDEAGSSPLSPARGGDDRDDATGRSAIAELLEARDVPGETPRARRRPRRGLGLAPRPPPLRPADGPEWLHDRATRRRRHLRERVGPGHPVGGRSRRRCEAPPPGARRRAGDGVDRAGLLADRPPRVLRRDELAGRIAAPGDRVERPDARPAAHLDDAVEGTTPDAYRHRSARAGAEPARQPADPRQLALRAATCRRPSARAERSSSASSPSTGPPPARPLRSRPRISPAGTRARSMRRSSSRSGRTSSPRGVATSGRGRG